MDKRYNLYNLVSQFKSYLLAGKIKSSKQGLNRKVLKKTTIKNYLSDLRHFLSWFQYHLANASSSSPVEIIASVDVETILKYKQYLVDNKLPNKTVNRRLSTLRKFFSFCISQDWIKINPAKQVINVVAGKNKAKLSKSNDKRQIDILDDFKKYLDKTGLDGAQINNTLSDISEFISLVKSY